MMPKSNLMVVLYFNSVILTDVLVMCLSVTKYIHIQLLFCKHCLCNSQTGFMMMMFKITMLFAFCLFLMASALDRWFLGHLGAVYGSGVGDMHCDHFVWTQCSG